MNVHNINFNSEFQFKTSRSGGKGGQNVNKVSTKVELIFNVRDSALLTDEQKNIIENKLGSRINKNRELQIVSQEDRSQLGNKEIVIKKFYALITKCFVVKKKRIATKVSKASEEKRLEKKKRDSMLKKLRKYKNDY